jgi:hypothetical protein
MLSTVSVAVCERGGESGTERVEFAIIKGYANIGRKIK